MWGTAFQAEGRAWEKALRQEFLGDSRNSKCTEGLELGGLGDGKR